MESDYTILPYQPEHAVAFKALNEAWITRYFRMEETDERSLGDPQGYILEKGGHILMVMQGDRAIGTCALIAMPDSPYDYELAKMAISPEVQGLGLGWKLGMAIVDLARSLGASSLYLESNTRLKPAISLYRKLGFVEVDGLETPYERCNIKMVLEL